MTEPETIRTVAAAAVLALCAVPSLAEPENGLYVAAGGGTASYQLKVSPVEIEPPPQFGTNRLTTDTDATPLALRLGYRRGFVAAEVGWISVGETGFRQGFVQEETGRLSRYSNVTDEISGPVVQLVGFLPRLERPVWDRFTLYGKAGVLFWRAEASGANLVFDDPFDSTSRGVRDTATTSGESFGFGFGLLVRVTGKLFVRLELEEFLQVGERVESGMPILQDSAFQQPIEMGFEEDLDVLTLGLQFSF